MHHYHQHSFAVNTFFWGWGTLATGTVCWCHVLKEISPATLMTFTSLIASVTASREILAVWAFAADKCVRQFTRGNVVSCYRACTFRKTLCAPPGCRHWTAEAQMLMLPGFAPRLEKAQVKHGAISPWAVTHLRQRVLDNKIPDQATTLSWFVGPLFLWFSVLILTQGKHWRATFSFAEDKA